MRVPSWSVLLGFALVLPTHGQLRLTEVLTSNGAVSVGEMGETPDWIELQWQGTAAGALSDYQLVSGDGEIVPLPEQELAPGQRMVLFASGRDAPRHLPFRLGAVGESLTLIGPQTRQEVQIPALPRDLSYGVAEQSILATPTPGETNAAPIGPPPVAPRFSHPRGFVSAAFDLEMQLGKSAGTIYYTLDGTPPSATHGAIYQKPIHITQTTIVRAVCLLPDCLPSEVTTASYLFPDDILTPTQEPPRGWPVGSFINRQRMVYGMEAAVNVGATHEELVDGLRCIPTVSLVMNLEDLLGEARGIYTHAEERGREWERSVSMEWIDPRTPGKLYQADAGLRMRGGFSRHQRSPKHNFRVIARVAYGDEAFAWPCFGETGPNRCFTMDLRSPQNHSWSTDGSADNTFLRDGFCRDTQRDLGQPYTRGQYVHLFLNGVYWGVYETHERIDADYAERYLGADGESVDVIKAAHPGVLETRTEAREGDLRAWRHLWESVNRLAAQRSEEKRLALYYELQGLSSVGELDEERVSYVDVPSLIDYMMIILFSANHDAPISEYFQNVHPNNWFAVRDQGGREGFRFFIHDSEHSLGLPYGFGDNRTGPYPGGADFVDSNPQWLHQQLMSVPEYRKAFGDRAAALLGPGGPLTVTACLERLAERENVLASVMALHAARWGAARSDPPRTKQDWLGAVARLKQVLIERPSVLLPQLQQAKRFALGDPSQHFLMAPLYPWVDAPQLWNVIGKSLEVKVTAPEGEVIYTLDGVDPNDAPSPGSAVTGNLVTKNVLEVGHALRVASEKQLGASASTLEWTQVTFNDSNWKVEALSPGCGTGDYGYIEERAEPVSPEEIYVRAVFSLDDLDTLVDLQLQLPYEDGYVAYLNGREIGRREAVRSRLLEETTVPDFMDLRDVATDLREGSNVLGLAMRRVARSPQPMRVAPVLVAKWVKGGQSLAIGEQMQMKARAKSGRLSSALSVYQTSRNAERASAENLVISEIMYHPPAVSEKERRLGVTDPDAFEFLEFLNIGSKPINLAKVRFIDGIQFQFPDRGTPLSPGARLVVAKNPRAFALRYPDVKGLLGPYAGALKNSGERLTVLDSHSQPIVRFRYEDNAPWPSSADGLGFSLVLADPSHPGNLNKASSWRASDALNGSPGSADEAVDSSGIVINEILTNSEWPSTDAIEIYNSSEHVVDISGWYLTDNVKEPKKWRVPPSTVMPPKSYWVVYEDDDADPGNNGNLGPNYFGSSFSLSSLGEEVFIFSADAAGELTGYTHGCVFDALPTGISFSRSINSAGKDVFAIAVPTLGEENGLPLLGPVLFTEVHYHPEEADADESSEFIEIWNRTDRAITLFDPERPEEIWALKGAKFTFPPGETLEPHEVALIVRVSPDDFRKERGLPDSLKVFGPFEGNLSNTGERLTLVRPLAPQQDGEETVVPMVPVDSIRYNDKAPWPEAADGLGASLERVSSTGITDEPRTWQASQTMGGTPGRVTLSLPPPTTTKHDDEL